MNERVTSGWEARVITTEKCLRIVLPSVLAGAALGLGLWWALNLDKSAYYVSNKASEEFRQSAFVFSLVGMAVAFAMHGVSGWLDLRADGGSVRESLERVAHRARSSRAIAYCVPPLAFCFAPGVETKRPGVLTVAILFTAVCCGYAISQMMGPRSRRWGDWTEKTGFQSVVRAVPLSVVGAACVLYTTYFSLGSMAIHRRLQSHLDLAVYENVLWNTSRGNFLGCTICKGGTHASSHFDPILAALAPIYRLFPETSTLFIAESAWLASGALPLYALALHQLKSRWSAAAIALCYLLAPSLHGANLFGFHSLVLCAPFVFCAIYFFEVNRIRGYWVSIALLLLVREDMALVATGIGAWAYFSQSPRVGLATVGVAFAYLAVVKAWAMMDSGLIMQNSTNTVSFAHYFTQLVPHKGEGGKGLVVSVLTNPIYLVAVVFREVKFRYFSLLLAPILGLSLFAPRRLWVCSWGLFFVCLATRGAVFSPHFQYSLLLLPGLFAALPAGLSQASEFFSKTIDGRSAFRSGAVVSCLVASILMSAKFGALVENDALRGGWEKPAWSLDLNGYSQYRAAVRLGARVPRDNTLAATRGLLPYVADRDLLSKRLDAAEYVLIDRKHFPKNAQRAWKRAQGKWKFDTVEKSRGIELYRRAEPRKPLEK